MTAPVKLRFLVKPESDGHYLRDFLRSSGVSATLIKGVKQESNGFWADEKTIRTCDRVQQGQVITFTLPPEPPTSVEAQQLPIAIAYESDHVIVLEKPAGMAVHPTLNYKDGTLANAYMGLLQKRGQEGVFRPVNRIDRDTSGLVLCAKNAWAAPLLAESAQKIYRAVLEGNVPDSGVIDAPIGRAPDSIILRCVDPAGKPSRTEYTTEKRTESYALVSAVPVTGRTHQLRVHFASIGCPLAGDELYGGKRDRIGRHALHCARISFRDPVSRRPVIVDSPLPQDISALMKM